MVAIEILIIVLLVLVNGILAMTELAVVSARRQRLQQDADRDDHRAQIVLDLMNSPSAFLATIQIGITLIGIIAGVFGGASLAEDLAEVFAEVSWLSGYAEPAAFSIVVLLITTISLIFGELIPKRIALAYPEAIAKLVAPFMRRFGRVTSPLVGCLEFVTEALLKPLRLKTHTAPDVSEADIRDLVEQGSAVGVIGEGEKQIINRVIRLGDRPLYSLMTPRRDIRSVKLTASIEENLRVAIESRRSLLPLVGENVEEILGVVSIYDLFECAKLRHPDPERLRSLAVVPHSVPGSASALRLLDEFLVSHNHFAIVLDEYGGVAGIATMHDLLEAIVGEVRDSSHEEYSLVRRSDGSVLVDSQMSTDELFRELEIFVPEELAEQKFRSVSGFVMDSLGKVPTEGDFFQIFGHRFEVVDMDQHRIDKVLVSKVEPVSDAVG